MNVYLNQDKFDNFLKCVYFDPLIQQDETVTDLQMISRLNPAILITRQLNEKENILTFSLCCTCCELCTLNFFHETLGKINNDLVSCSQCYTHIQ